MRFMFKYKILERFLILSESILVPLIPILLNDKSIVNLVNFSKYYIPFDKNSAPFSLILFVLLMIHERRYFFYHRSFRTQPN